MAGISIKDVVSRLGAGHGRNVSTGPSIYSGTTGAIAKGITPIAGGTGAPIRPNGGNSGFLGVQVIGDARSVISALNTVGRVGEIIPAAAFAQFGEKWKEMIKLHTPVGPERDLSRAKNKGLSLANIGSQPTLNLGSSTYSPQQIMRAYEAWETGTSNLRSSISTAGMSSAERRAMNRELVAGSYSVPTGKGGRNLKRIVIGSLGGRLGVDGKWEMSHRPDIQMNSTMLRKNNAARMVSEGMVGQSGRLIDSIEVRLTDRKGQASLEAYSELYYAWYVENGYLSYWRPIKRMPNRGEVHYSVFLSQLGQYSYFDTMAQSNRADGAGAFVAFVRRTSPKPIEGYHMFLRGTDDFELYLQEEFWSLIESAYNEVWSSGQVSTGVAKTGQILTRSRKSGRFVSRTSR